MSREKAQAGDPRGRKYRWATLGADCPIVAMKRGNARGAKGAGHSRRGRWVNGRPEEPNFFVGRRQPSVGGTSRMRRESHVRFCERPGVKLPGPTRRWETRRCHMAQLLRPSSTLPHAVGAADDRLGCVAQNRDRRAAPPGRTGDHIVPRWDLHDGVQPTLNRNTRGGHQTMDALTSACGARNGNGDAGSSVKRQPLPADGLRRTDAYWRAADYVAVEHLSLRLPAVARAVVLQADSPRHLRIH